MCGHCGRLVRITWFFNYDDCFRVKGGMVCLRWVPRPGSGIVVPTNHLVRSMLPQGLRTLMTSSTWDASSPIYPWLCPALETHFTRHPCINAYFDVSSAWKSKMGVWHAVFGCTHGALLFKNMESSSIGAHVPKVDLGNPTQGRLCAPHGDMPPSDQALEAHRG